MDSVQEFRLARIFKSRLFKENPLLHPEVFPIDFSAARTSSSGWVEITFGDLEENDVVQFPKLEKNEINPIALEITSGPHALKKGNSILTYMRQICLKNHNLTRDQTVEAMKEFPNSWKLQYLDLRTPPQFQPTPANPRWIPEWWDEEIFGRWRDIRLVRCRIPPSFKSALTPGNFHWVVIAFGDEPSNRLGLRPPYDQIYFWRCFKCPALNGSLSMDRHLAAFLQALSFKSLYKPSSKTANILNTVADRSRQATQVLPPAIQTAPIPVVQRRSRDTRRLRDGELNPLYDHQFTARARASTNIFTNSSGSEGGAAAAVHTDDANNNTEEAAEHNSSVPQPGSRARGRVPRGGRSAGRAGRRGRGGRGSAARGGREGRASESVPRGGSVPRGRTVPRGGTEPRGGSVPRGSTAPLPRSSGPSHTDSLDIYLSQFDPHNLYPIPDASQPRDIPGFTRASLQKLGLLNDGNICSLISVMLCFHRIGLSDHLIDPELCADINGTPDYPLLVLSKILLAMPSPASFSIQMFVEAWNVSKTPLIYPGFADVAALTDGLLENLQLKQYQGLPPVFSQYLASFKCNHCGLQLDHLKTWDGQVQPGIPYLQVPENGSCVDIANLLADFIDETVETRCTNASCNERINDGKIEAIPGQFTVLSVNRLDITDRSNKLKNKLSHFGGGRIRADLVGELISVICHRGNVDRGHFVSYHKVGEDWFLNNDSRLISAAENPLNMNNDSENETIEVLFLKNV